MQYAHLSYTIYIHILIVYKKNGRFTKLSRKTKRALFNREGKVERIKRQPFFPLSAVVCPVYLVKSTRDQAGQTTADRGKKWLSINSLYLTLPIVQEKLE